MKPGRARREAKARHTSLLTAAKQLRVEIEATRGALAALSDVRAAAESVPPGLFAFRYQPSGHVKVVRRATTLGARLPIACVRNALIEIVASAEQQAELRLNQATAELALTEARIRRVKEEIEHLEQERAA